MPTGHIAIAITALFSGLMYATEPAHVAGMIQSDSSDAGTHVSANELPTYSKLRDEVRMLLRTQAASETLSEEVANTLPLTGAVKGLTADPRFATSPTLQALRGRLFARLRRIKKDTVSVVRRQKKKPTSIQIEPHVLGQLNQARNPNPANNRNNALAAADYGPQLIDLIQRTISPHLWDVNGGASTIQYWRPGMAIVVRAPGAVHREMNPLLRQLRQ